MAPRLPASVERATALAILSLPAPALRRIAGPARRSPEGYVLDLQLHALLRLIEVLKVPQTHEGTVEEARSAIDRSCPTLDYAPPLEVGAYDREVAGAAGPLRARVYTPARRARRGGAPGLVYFHGGGWVIGSVASHDRVCRALAAKSGAVVVSVEYRLAPEHVFPAAAQDAVAATRAVLADAPAFGIDPARVAVGGDSAGGNLAAVASQALRRDTRRPAFQLLVYPGTDMTCSFPSHRHFRDGYFLPESAIHWFRSRYAPDPATHRDPRASPLFAEDLSGLPRALVVTAGFDPLRDEGRAYAEKMRAAGVDTEHVCAEGLMHAFFNMGGALRASARIVDLVADRLRTALGA